MLVSRDPFAREELHVKRVYTVNVFCSWCGQVKELRDGRTYLYRYRVETDGGRTYEDSRLFCSVACRRAYNG